MDKFISLQYHQTLFYYMAITEGHSISKNRNKIADKILYTHVSAFVDNNVLQYNDALGFLFGLREYIEKEISDIISTKSIMYWFHLYRRIAPEESFAHETPSIRAEYRNILETAFVKYGKENIDSELIEILPDATETDIDKITKLENNEAKK